ncbi:hypothetical protein C8F01DRAFT_1172916 [Mycena amicta]|nr:hypothetical protein C8F01DRAFT_1172916 [Mycena amicta]
MDSNPPKVEVGPDALSASSTMESEAPDTAEQAGSTTPTERKLTIRVPVKYDYIPPTPPSSAEFEAYPPAIPPHRQSLAPVSTAILAKRASAPVQSWSTVHARALAKDSNSPALKSDPSPTIPPPSAPAPTAPLPAVPEVQQEPSSGHITPKSVVEEAPTPSSSAIHLPSAETAAPNKPPPPPPPSIVRQSASSTLAPPSQSSSRTRRKSAPQQPPQRVRNSPSYVSLIEFDSSEDEDGGNVYDGGLDDGHEREDSAQSSIPEEPEEDADLARWAPEPAFIPARIPISATQSRNGHVSRRPDDSASHPASTRSRSSVRSSDREGSLAGISHRMNPLSKTSSNPGSAIRHHAGAHHGLSALPNELVQRDVDYTLRALMSPAMFARMLGEPLARQRFREFLLRDGRGAKELDFWTDVRYLEQAMEDLRGAGQVFRDLYVSGNDTPMPLTPEARRELRGVLQQVLAADAGLGTTQTQLLESMYNDGFQRFVKHQIIQEAHVALGRANLTAASAEVGDGLGDTFVLTNPRLPDHPIVLVSDGFVAVTGYPRAQIVGRNCRFLQGPGTPPASVQRIRDGLNSGKGCTELLLNYRRDGEPFYCLLCIIPVRDASGSIVYFIGGQTNVTGLLMTEKGLSLGLQGDGPLPVQSAAQMSPAMAAVASRVLLPTDPTVAPRNGAAGQGVGGVMISGSASRGSGGGFLKGLFGRNGGGSGLGYGSGIQSNSNPRQQQVIAGAEATMNAPGEMRFQDQYAVFQHTYNKVLIFKLKKREITFVSPQMLAYLGLPTRTQREQLASSLIRSDMASLITAGDGDRNETRRMREQLKDAVRRGVPCSMYCGVKIPGKGMGLLARNDDRASRYKFGMMHLTPIKDGDNVAVAFVSIFG